MKEVGQMMTFRPSAKFDKQAALIMLDEQQVNQKKFLFQNKEVQKKILSLVSAKQFAGEEYQLFPVCLGKITVLLVGLGKKNELTPTKLRILLRRAFRSAYLKASKSIEVIFHEQSDWAVKGAIDSFCLGTYSWRKYKTNNGVIAKSVFLVAPSKKSYEDTITICEGTNLARDLINDNADYVTSDHIEKIIRNLIKGKKNISIEILNKKEMKAKGLGLHLAVNRSSPKEPKLIIVKYQGSTKSEAYTAFIGKGMTFDTGGLNLKPTGSIETMRLDMSGAGAVVGTLKNTIALKLKKNILFVVAMAENVTGSRSYKPGDVIKGYAGKTVEIGNTDAEGRLVLADAIAYIIKNYKPARLIDIATLTGACVVALGYDYTGLVTTDDQFSRQLVRASNETDDRVWRLPSYPELKDHVKSEIADIRNIGLPKGVGGTISAAEFLRQFTNGTKWAHLDIAGTSFAEGKGRMYFGYGATGAGVRLMTSYLQNN